MWLSSSVAGTKQKMTHQPLMKTHVQIRINGLLLMHSVTPSALLILHTNGQLILCRPPMPTYIAIYNPIHPHQKHLHHRYSIHLCQHSGPVSVGQHQLFAPQTLDRYVPNFVPVVKKVSTVVLTAGTRPHGVTRSHEGDSTLYKL